MDTVRPCKGIEPVVEDGVIRSAGDTILSADDKAGVAAIFEGVRNLIEAGEALPDVHVVLTTCEEMHLLGAGALDTSFQGGAGGLPYALGAHFRAHHVQRRRHRVRRGHERGAWHLLAVG